MFILLSVFSFASEEIGEVQKDFSVRSLGWLDLRNLRGSISVQGWPLDKIRVTAKKFVKKDIIEGRDEIAKTMDFRFVPRGNDVEVACEYGKGLGIREKLQERSGKAAWMTFEIQAPSDMKLRAWSDSGEINIKNWHSRFEGRSESGDIKIAQSRDGPFFLRCLSCLMDVVDVAGEIKIQGGDKAVSLSEVSDGPVFVETQNGNINVQDIKASKQLYVSRGGEIKGQGVWGDVQFLTKSGNVEFREVRGSVSGRADTAKIVAEIYKWAPVSETLVETLSGDIDYYLPPEFGATIDIWSVFGEVKVEYSVVESKAGVDFYGPQPANKIFGHIGDSAYPFKALSNNGSIRLIKRKQK